MFEEGSTLYMIAGGIAIVVFLMFFGRGLPAMFKRSEEAPKDWQGLLFPLLFVVVIVALVASML